MAAQRHTRLLGAWVLGAGGVASALAGMGWVVLAVKADDSRLLWQVLVVAGVSLHRLLCLWLPWSLAGLLTARLPDAEGWMAWRWAVAVAVAEVLLQLGWFGHGYAGLSVSLVDLPGAATVVSQFGSTGLSAWLLLAVAAITRLLLGLHRMAGLQPARPGTAACIAIALLAPSLWIALTPDAPAESAGAAQSVLALTSRGERHGDWTALDRDSAVQALMLAMHSAPPGSVVLTPETYFGAAPPPETEGLWADLVSLARQRSLQVLAGMPNYFGDAQGVHTMNSVTQITGDRFSVYGKERLVPFAEYLPWPGLLQFVYRHVFEAALGHQQPAPLELREPLYVQGHAVGVLICHELSFSSTTAERARQADWLFSASYDGWIDSAAYRAQMLGLTRLRAMETGKPVLRVVAGGDSYLVEQQGLVLARWNSVQGPWFRTTILSHPAASAYLGRIWLLPWLGLACLLAPPLIGRITRRRSASAATK